MIPNDNLKTVEDLVTDESFLNYYFQKNENDILDWEEWQEDSPTHIHLVQEAFQLIDRLSLKFTDAHNKTKLQDLLTQLKSHEQTTYDTPTFSKRIASFYIKIAAAAVLILLSWFIYNTTSKLPHTEGEGIALTSQDVVNKSVAKVSVYELSDGSVVRLNAGSSIHLADDFNVKTRDVYLEGEGYFEVAKNPTMPFRVHAGKSITTAIGTAFMVRAIKGETAVKVVLVEGKVKVENTIQKQTPVELVAGQQVHILEAAVTAVETLADANAATRWKDGYVLTFRETPFSDVMTALSENYKITITGYHKKELLSAKITAEFDKSTNISSVMEGLAFANGFAFTERNDTIFIK